jgi:hypothetical protein
MAVYITKRLLAISLFLFALWGCVKTPTEPAKNKHINLDTLSLPFPESGAMVLCEGLWNYTNSDIYLYDYSTSAMIESYFLNATNSYLGDIVSDVAMTDNQMIFTATGTKQLILIDHRTPAILHKINIDYDRAAPRSITLNDGNYYYTDLYRDEVRYGSFADSLSTPKGKYETGPAPEDIIAYNEKLFIANSGFGDYRQEDKNAGTLQIIDIATGQSDYVYIGPNLIKLELDTADNYIACGYLNTPTGVNNGEPGGIVFVDLTTHQVKQQMYIKDFTDVQLSQNDGRIYYLTKEGVYTMHDIYSRALPQLIIENTTKDIWYSLSYNEQKQELWIGNARNYQSDGEVIVTDEQGQIIRRHEVGKNPSNVVFY